MPRVTNMKTTGVKTTGQTFFFVGPPNTGKTHMATTFPGPTLVLNFDGKQNNWANTDATLIEYEISAQVAMSEYNLMLSHIRALKKGEAIVVNGVEVIPAGKRFNTIVIDSMTTWAEMVWPRVMLYMPMPAPGEPDKFARMRYSYQKQFIVEPLNEIRNLATICDANVIVIAHSTEDYDNATDAPLGTFKASVTGKLKEYMPSFSCEVYYFATKKLPGNTLKYECWTRSRLLPDARSSISNTAFPECIENLYAAWEHYATRYARTRLPFNVEESTSATASPTSTPPLAGTLNQTKGGTPK